MSPPSLCILPSIPKFAVSNEKSDKYQTRGIFESFYFMGETFINSSQPCWKIMFSIVFKQFYTNNKMKIIKLKPVLLSRDFGTNKTDFNPIVFEF